MGRTSAFTPNRPGIPGFVCFNARNSYNRILRHCRATEAQLSGRRGVPAVPSPTAPRAPEPRAHLPPAPQPPQPGPSPGSAGPEPSAAPVPTYGRAEPGREQRRVRPRSPQLSRRGTGAVIPGSRGPGPAGLTAPVTRCPPEEGSPALGIPACTCHGHGSERAPLEQIYLFLCLSSLRLDFTSLTFCYF